MLFSLLKHYLDTDIAQKVSQSVYCSIIAISHGVKNYFPRLWGTGISDAIFTIVLSLKIHAEIPDVIIIFTQTKKTHIGITRKSEMIYW